MGKGGGVGGVWLADFAANVFVPHLCVSPWPNGAPPPPFTAALQFGVQQRGFDALTNVAVFDVGSSKTEVGVFTFGPKAEEKKSKTFDSVGLGTCGQLVGGK